MNQLFWLALPFVLGGLGGLIISHFLKPRWKASIELQLRQDRELRELLGEESD
jgi:uncharacterized protein involved in exopolysaccharide biosynthesis